MPILYHDDHESRGYILVLLNVLKHMFLDMICRYKSNALTFTSQMDNKVTEEETIPVSINNDDVNHFFGWAVFKLKKISKNDSFVRD